MTVQMTYVDRHRRLVAGVPLATIIFLVVWCLLDGVIPICRWLFRCGRRMQLTPRRAPRSTIIGWGDR